MSSRRQERLRALGRQLADEQDELLAQRELSAPAWPAQRSLRRGVERRLRSRALLSVGVIALAASLGLAWLRTRPLQVTLAGGASWSVGETVQAERHALAVRFSDASELQLSPGSRAALLQLTHAGAAVQLASGHARVSITPGRHGVWTLHAGRFAVHVTGTRFELDYDAHDEQLTVRMHEGKVLVTGCALATPEPLSAGESLRAACRTGSAQLSRDGALAPRAEDVPADTSAPAHSAQVAAAKSARAAAGAALAARQTHDSSAPAIAPGEGTSRAAAQPRRSAPDTHAGPPSLRPTDRAPSTPAHAQPAPPEAAASSATSATGTLTWQQLARAGKFEAAYALGRTVEHAQLSIADLLLFGDTARLSTEATAALEAYAEVRRRDPRSDAAAVAAFASGRVQFDQRAAFPEAARWFQTYLRERASGPLAREAHGRLVEALERAGEHAAARRSAEQYLRAYPSGPHAAFARTVLTSQ